MNLGSGGFGVWKICSFLQQRVFGCEQNMEAKKDESAACCNDDLIRTIFNREVFSLLLRRDLIHLDLVRKLLSGRHTGFNDFSRRVAIF